ncbi:ATP-grasp domain-containing protein [Roseiconus nitratireducens]|uniref:ATP-grasp domain-containing protein n=1 Tax=Roseiconus nitratireducens TaxID=2605748 RepID=A0A5M6DD28_9BACT|nr:ATP-grasp domain-containing protein [Roseiconus nitratireducens]KAA5544310.1 ATP-grasp domain-containing protein [Roseiconus nitratireducens]
MKVFVGEYICGGGFAGHDNDQIPAGMRQEGEAMLRALNEDLSRFSETTAVVEQRFGIDLEFCDIVPFNEKKSLWAQWVAAARGCDAAIIIAPESDGIMAMGVAALRSSGVDTIACSGDFLRVASDKLLTAQLLHRTGVAHPMYYSQKDRRMAKRLATRERFVVKPRDGCGTHAIRTFDNFEEARRALCEKTLLQAWVPGRSISISLLASGAYQTFLPAVSQTITEDSCHYVGGCGPLDDDSQRRAAALASHAIAAMPPTARGFVGLDLILGDEPGEDYVIEINPRLTTSYVGLRKMIHGNLAARLFDLELGPVKCKASVDSVSWTPDGKVSIDSAVTA